MAQNFLAAGGDFEEIQRFCGVKTVTPDFQFAVEAACDEVYAKCGPVLAEEVTVQLLAPAIEQVLPVRPTAVVSVAPTVGDPLDVTGFAFAGQRLWRTGGEVVPAGTVVVAAGWPSAIEVPFGLRFAASLLARHLWRTQLGNQRANETDITPGSAWLWPAQAKELARPYMLAPTVFA